MFAYNIYELRRHSYASSNTDENSLMDLYLHKINIYIRLASGERRRHANCRKNLLVSTRRKKKKNYERIPKMFVVLHQQQRVAQADFGARYVTWAFSPFNTETKKHYIGTTRKDIHTITFTSKKVCTESFLFFAVPGKNNQPFTCSI